MPGRIPWSVVREWAGFHDYPGDAVAFLDACFAGMDAAFTEHYLAGLPKAAG